MAVNDNVDDAIDRLPLEELRAFMAQVTEHLYWAVTDDDAGWSKDKEWDGDTLSFIAECLPEDVYKAIVKESE